MNKLLYFLLGGAVGAGITYYFMKKEIDSLVDEINEFNEYNDISGRYKNDEETDDGVNPLSDEERNDIREKLNKNYEGTTSYASMYNKKVSEDVEDELIENEHPEDSDEDELTEEQEEALSATEEHRKNKNKPPKIISEEAVADLPSYIDNELLYFYTEDGVLVNEEEEELDPSMFIGDALTKYGFESNDEEKIFVMNYALDVCYEVAKIRGAWEDVKL